LFHDTVTTDVKVIDANQGDSAAILTGRGPASRTAPTDDAWLAQAMRLRAEAFRLAQRHFLGDLGPAVQPKSGRIPTAATSRADYADKLTADYLVESEKMIDLMRTLAPRG
jgi:hypothetical protein